jgi:phospholipid/cholesterol/gamma-HCH transport system permease protein
MRTHSVSPAAVSQTNRQVVALSGCWTARGLGEHESDLVRSADGAQAPLTVDASGIEALDTAGAWVLHTLLAGPGDDGAGLSLQGLPAEFAELLESVRQHAVALAHEAVPAAAAVPSVLESTGRGAAGMVEQWLAMLSFIGESAHALAEWLLHPSRIRWRAVLFNLRSAGFDALPIVGLLSFLRGILVA